MFTLALVIPLLLTSTGECYLVTAEGIDDIPCDFSAAATDALRYAAEDTPEAKARRVEQERRDATRRHEPRRRPVGPGSARGKRGR